MLTSKNILLVEDNMDDELLTIRALKKHDPSFEIHVARDGVEALDYLFEKSRENIKDVSILPKLIILDLQLPKMGGIEVLRRIKTNHCNSYDTSCGSHFIK
jgi:two-component system response regulator